MKIKIIFALLIVISGSCAPIPATVSSSETVAPNTIQTSAPTPTAILTPIPVSYIEGLNNIPTPDTAFINQVVDENYLKVMGITREQVDLVYFEHTGLNQQPFTVMVDDTTGVPLGIYFEKWTSATLRFLGEQNGIAMGTDTAENYTPAEMQIMSSFTRATVEIGIAWDDTEPQQNHINKQVLAKSAKIETDLKRNGVNEIIVHAAIYPGQFPSWLRNGVFSQTELREIMKKRIQSVISNNPDASFLVVVNEPYLPKEINPDRSSYDVFYHAWGSYEYIKEAFQYARDIGGNDLMLIYNDGDNHYPIGQSSQASKRIVEMLKKDGLIDYVGMQMHIGEWRDGAFDELMIPQIPKEIEFYKKLGVPVLITELTYQPDNNYLLSEYRTAYSQEDFEKRLSHVFGEICRIAIESGNVRGITFWGLTDRFFKLDNVNWYMIYDEHGQPKQAYYIVLKTLYEGLKQ